MKNVRNTKMSGMMTNNYNVCKGCYTSQIHPGTPCVLLRVNHKCPCVTCLVKGMCNKQCEKFEAILVEENLNG